MRRAAKIAGAVVGGLLAPVVVLLVSVVGGSATGPGHRVIERLLPSLTGGMLRASGLSGWLFGTAHVARLEVLDPRGTWMTIEDLTLDWAPLRLLSGQVMVRRVDADRVAVERPFVSGSSSTTGLSLRIDIEALHIDRLDLAPSVVGLVVDQAAQPPAQPVGQPAVQPALRTISPPAISPSAISAPAISPGTISLLVDGAGRLDSSDQGAARLTVRRLNGEGTYAVDARFDPAGVHATLHLAEPAGGLIASLAALPAIGAITADATFAGPLNAVDTDLALTAGPLRAHIAGRVDGEADSADLTVSADAPAMAPRPDLSWHGITLRGRVHGAFSKPDASATLVADGLVLGLPGSGQGEVGRITADLEGNAGEVRLNGTVNDIRLPGPKPDTLASAPLLVTAAMRLDTPDRKLTFGLRHALFTIDGTAVTAGQQQIEAHLTVPEIAPLAAADGIDVGGSAGLTLNVARLGADTRVAAQGSFVVTNGPGPAPTLLGQDTKLDVLGTLHGQSVDVSRLNIDSGSLSVGLNGTVAPGALNLDWRVAVADLAKVNPGVSGPFQATGKISGAPDNISVTADLAGTVGAPGLAPNIAPGAVNAQVILTGLPNAPTGHVAAHGTLLGAPVDLEITAARQDGGIRVAIERAEWKSLHADGVLQTAAAPPLAQGQTASAPPTAPGQTASTPPAQGQTALESPPERGQAASVLPPEQGQTAPAMPLPQGQVSFAMTRLADLQPLLGLVVGEAALRGQALRGSVTGKFVSTDAGAALTVKASDAGLAGIATVERAALDAKVADPMTHPRLDGRLTLDGIAASGVGGSARIEAAGPLNALALRLAATLPELQGAPATVDAAGTVDAASRVATIASLRADWKQAPIRLLAPVRISFADGISVARLRIGLRQAVLEANGRISPTLDFTAQLRGVPASLAELAEPTPAEPPPNMPPPDSSTQRGPTQRGPTQRGLTQGGPAQGRPAQGTPAQRTSAHGAAAQGMPAPGTPASGTPASGTRAPNMPTLAIAGTVDADARLTGTPARPSGTIHVTARGLRALAGPGSALPAADVTATAILQGEAVRIDLRGVAGTTRLAVTGTAPLTADGVLGLHATASLDLAVTDPVLTPAGRRARGKASLDATITGTPAAPQVNGGARLTDGSFRDYAAGIDLEAIDAALTADGGSVRVTQFSAKAGTGTIGGSGSLDLTAPGRPLDLVLTARAARPLANALLTSNLDADLTLRGELGGHLTAGGRVFVRHADIRIPETMPPSVPRLNVRVAGAPPPAPAASVVPGPNVTLDVTIDAPEQIFVRGRGVNAELGGTVRLQGSAANPLPSGGFELRRGDVSVAGQTLTFASGKVSFDGGSLTDPSLDFISTNTAGDVTATLEIAGTASRPKIILSSSPSMPQDEVLSYLLFGQGTVSLGALQVAEIAAGLASMTGAGSALSNPLENLRVAAGLDRLGVGASGAQAGRYVTRNIYIGAQQSITGAGTQAVVDVDITKRLKLEAAVGTGGSSTPQSATGSGASSGGSSVGLKYQFEY